MKKLVLMAVAAVAVSASVSFVSCGDAPKAEDTTTVEEVVDSACCEADSTCCMDSIDSTAVEVVEAVEEAL